MTAGVWMHTNRNDELAARTEHSSKSAIATKAGVEVELARSITLVVSANLTG